MSGYNLPESTGPNDPEAPWNQQEMQEGEAEYTCIVCGKTLSEDEVFWLADESFCGTCIQLEGTEEEH